MNECIEIKILNNHSIANIDCEKAISAMKVAMKSM